MPRECVYEGSDESGSVVIRASHCEEGASIVGAAQLNGKSRARVRRRAPPRPRPDARHSQLESSLSEFLYLRKQPQISRAAFLRESRRRSQISPETSDKSRGRDAPLVTLKDYQKRKRTARVALLSRPFFTNGIARALNCTSAFHYCVADWRMLAGNMDLSARSLSMLTSTNVSVDDDAPGNVLL